MEVNKRELNETVNKAKELMLEMQQEAEKYTKLSVLTKMDLVKTVKLLHGARYIKYVTLIEQARWYLKDKKKEHEDAYKWLCETIKEDFCDEEFEIVEISVVGYEEYGYDMVLNVCGRRFRLLVPDIEKLNDRHFEDMYEGKLTMTEQKDGSCVWQIFVSSYFADDIKQALKHRINKGFEITEY